MWNVIWIFLINVVLSIYCLNPWVEKSLPKSLSTWVNDFRLNLLLYPCLSLTQSIHQICESESRSVVSNSLQPHGLYSPWNSPGQNTGVGSLSILQGIFPTQGSNPGLPHCRGILYQLSHKDPLIETMIKMFRKEVLALASEILHITLWIHQTDVDRGLCITSLHDVATHFMKTAG